MYKQAVIHKLKIRPYPCLYQYSMAISFICFIEENKVRHNNGSSNKHTYIHPFIMKRPHQFKSKCPHVFSCNLIDQVLSLSSQAVWQIHNNTCFQSNAPSSVP